MDQREFHLQPMGICHRFYHFLTKALASQASKTVTLGRSRCDSSRSATAVRSSDSKAKKEVQSEEPCKVDEEKKLQPTEGVIGNSISISSPVQQAEEKNKPSMNADKMEGENDAVLTLPTPSLAPMRSIRKTVSISEKVEEIFPPKKLKRKWSRSFQRSMSLDQDEEPVPPPRSILKSNSFS